MHKPTQAPSCALSWPHPTPKSISHTVAGVILLKHTSDPLSPLLKMCFPPQHLQHAIKAPPTSWDPLITTCSWFPPSSLSLPCLTHAVPSTSVPFFTWLTLTHPLDPEAPSTIYLVRFLQAHNLDSVPTLPALHPHALRASSAFLSPSLEVTSYNIGSFY